MAWDFSTEPEFEAKLDWIRQFVRDEVEPLAAMRGYLGGAVAPKRADVDHLVTFCLRGLGV